MYQRHTTQISMFDSPELFGTMQCLVQHKPEQDAVYAFIQKKRSEGKSGKEAMIAGLNKFLRIYYGRVSEVYKAIDEQLIFGSEI